MYNAVLTRSATYVLGKFSKAPKDRIICWSHGDNTKLLGRSFSVDALIADACTYGWQKSCKNCSGRI